MKNREIAVFGGAYGEECAYPRRQIYRGSGGRAATVLSSLDAKVEFHTAVGPTLAPIFASLAKKFGYTLHSQPKADDIWFRYRHPLGRPTIHGAPHETLSQLQPQKVDLALVYGMIEGRPPIQAQRAVYDPQDGAKSKSFSANGSIADELALVVSYSEGKALTGETDPSNMASQLLQQPNVVIAIIKCGPQGALVQTPHRKDWVRPFATRNVYKIGSGDVFSAAFAYAWLLQEEEPLAAAWFASRITAAYVESAQDWIEPHLLDGYKKDAVDAAAKFTDRGHREIPKTQVYLAGPFFNTAQQWMIDETREALTDMGFDVFSPVHEIGIGPAHEVAPADLFALEKSGLVLALLDGLDAGTLFEVGYARAKEIPVVVVAEAVEEPALSMILGSGCEVANDLATGIYAACWQLMGDA